MKKKSLLLFKNAFKQTFRNKMQLIGLVVLVLLSSTIFSLMQTSLARIATEHQSLVQKSNLHDFVIDLTNTAVISNDSENNLNLKTNNRDEATGVLEQMGVNINNIAHNSDNEFLWDRVEGRTLQLANNGNSRVLKLLTANDHARIDKLVITAGYRLGDPLNPDQQTPRSKQVVINKEFAAKNNLALGDTIRVQQDIKGTSLKVTNDDINDPANALYNWLKIVGFGISADFTTPIIDKTTPLPNKTREGLLYVDPRQFGLTSVKNDNDDNYHWWYDRNQEMISVSANSDREIIFVGKWKPQQDNNLNLISTMLRQKYINTANGNAQLAYALGDSNYQFNSRTSGLPTTINAFRTLLIALLLIVLIITGITVIFITNKNIDNIRIQIGILKSLGYRNFTILFSSLAYPMITALLGTILVFLPASALQLIVISNFANYFNLDFGRFILNGLGFLYCLLLTFGFLSLVAWIISALTVIQNPITLIKNDSTTVNSRFNRFLKAKTSKRGFLTRFRLSLFSASLGKMSIVALTIFLGTTLMTTAIIGPKIMSDNKIVTYTGMNYDTLVEYGSPTYNSPFTMYKTYNPANTDVWDYKRVGSDNSNYWRPNRDNPEMYIKELLANDINSEAYAPMSLKSSALTAISDLGQNSLTFLYGKMLTKDFLSNLDDSQFDSVALAANFIAPNAWPVVVPLYNILKDTNNQSFYRNETYDQLRKFYQDYRSTIAMSINGAVTNTNSSSNNINDWSATAFDNFAKKRSVGSLFAMNIPAYNNTPVHGVSFKTAIQNFKFNNADRNYPLRLPNDKQLLGANGASLLPEDRNNWINDVSIWFGSLFYGRIGQTVVQGAYSRSPYFIRQNLAQAYENENSPFNISFNVVPFNKATDELGTYFTGTPLQKGNIDLTFNDKIYPLKVYGLQSEAQLGGNKSQMQLYDKNHVALNPLLEQRTTDGINNIVINETIAKQLKLEVNDQFTMATNGNVLKYHDKRTNSYQPFNNDNINFNKVSSSINDNNATLLTQKITFNDEGFISKGKDVYSNTGEAPPMLENVINGEVINDTDKTPSRFKVVGVYNGYGQPNAYISKTNADKLLHFDETRSMLYRLFQQEWQSKGQVNNIDFSWLKTNNYEQFQQLAVSSPLVQIFNSEYPIFNFKLGQTTAIADITNTFTTSQLYGDYSAFGLNGGESKNGTRYDGYGMGSAINIMPQIIHRQLLNQITALIDMLLLAFIIFAGAIAFFIILLTSNLVIYENRKTIATMKTLGYSNLKITNIVIGMYLPVIMIMFVIGFPVGWGVIIMIINFLAAHTTWVLPLFFAWWLPVVVALVVLCIYITTFIIDWQAMTKINILQTLKEID